MKEGDALIHRCKDRNHKYQLSRPPCPVSFTLFASCCLQAVRKACSHEAVHALLTYVSKQHDVQAEEKKHTEACVPVLKTYTAWGSRHGKTVTIPLAPKAEVRSEVAAGLEGENVACPEPEESESDRGCPCDWFGWAKLGVPGSAPSADSCTVTQPAWSATGSSAGTYAR